MYVYRAVEDARIDAIACVRVAVYPDECVQTRTAARMREKWQEDVNTSLPRLRFRTEYTTEGREELNSTVG